MTTLSLFGEGEFYSQTYPFVLTQLWDYSSESGNVLFSIHRVDGFAFDDLWAFNLATQQSVQLGAGGGIDGAQWAPGGLSFAALCGDELTVIRPSASIKIVALNVLWPEIGRQGFRWSPDGQQIAYFGRKTDGRGALWVISLADGKVTSIGDFDINLEFQYFNTAPVWSSDSQYVLYVDATLPSHLMIARADGSDQWQPVLDRTIAYTPPGGLDHILWSADSHTLIADGGENVSGDQGVWMYRLSSDLRTVTAFGLVSPSAYLKGWAKPGYSAAMEIWRDTVAYQVVELGQVTVQPTPTVAPSPMAEPTEPLPPIEPNAPEFTAWRGKPTYSAQEQPSTLFQLEFATARWALVGQQLFHRVIAHCAIAPTAGRGLPPDESVQEGHKAIGSINFETNAISNLSSGLLAINYATSVGGSYTAFAVSFYAEKDACIAEAEMVLGTLQAVPNPDVTPTP